MTAETVTRPCGCKHANAFDCAEKRTLDRIPCSCACHRTSNSMSIPADRLADVVRIVEDFVRRNSRWVNSNGVEQDPYGAHGWLEWYRSTSHETYEPRPAAWIRGHTMHTDAGLEYDEEVVPGTDCPPGKGWTALYPKREIKAEDPGSSPKTKESLP